MPFEHAFVMDTRCRRQCSRTACTHGCCCCCFFVLVHVRSFHFSSLSDSPRLLERAGTRRVIENSSLSLECNASANPDNITYNWNMPPSNSFCDANASGCSKRFLRIPNVHRSANGTVSCEAFNGIGNTKAKSSWTLNVLCTSTFSFPTYSFSFFFPHLTQLHLNALLTQS